MITWPLGVSWGSTTTLKEWCRRTSRSRRGEFDRQQVAVGIDVVGAVERVQVAPPSLEIRKPTPGRAGVALAGGGEDDRLVGVVVPGEDGDAADVDAVGRAEVGQRDVGRAGGVGGQEVGGLPDAAAGAGDVDGVARGVGRVDGSPDPATDLGPDARRRRSTPARPPSRCRWTAALVGSSVKMRKLALTWSATGSPRPVLGTGFWNVSDQALRVPAVVAPVALMTVSVQVPWAFEPANAASDCCGWNVPKKAAPPCWIGVDCAVVEDRVGEVGRVDAAADTAQTGPRWWSRE